MGSVCTWPFMLHHVDLDHMDCTLNLRDGIYQFQSNTANVSASKNTLNLMFSVVQTKKQVSTLLFHFYGTSGSIEHIICNRGQVYVCHFRLLVSVSVEKASLEHTELFRYFNSILVIGCILKIEQL